MTTEESVITDEMRAQIGVESEPWVVEVEKGAIARFADAIGDSNPLYRDEEYARKSRYGGIIAPPTFFGWPVGEPRQPARVETPFTRVLNGGTEVIHYRPIYAGEKLIATSKLADLSERQGRPGIGRMLIQINETTYRDMNGKIVALMRGTGISYEGPTSS